MNILLAIDGSEISVRATSGVASHVRWFAERPAIHVLHVHLPVPVGLALQHVSRETLDRYYLEEGEKVLAPALDLLRSEGLAVTTHIHVGQPAEVIVKLAGELACELICLGTHGRGAVATAVLGSVALKVLQFSQVPVLLFP
jgi:nucleotide-binding universal stress UspA family protein